MDVIYGLIPGMILLGLVGVGVFFWAARSGQFDDLEGEASRILMDDDINPPGSRSGDREVRPDEESGDSQQDPKSSPH